jgi:alpha,alpha-trehalase
MRESGFDPSNRFGPFSADITDYVPVCLNALLYQMERDFAQISRILGRADETKRWDARAEAAPEPDRPLLVGRERRPLPGLRRRQRRPT